MTIKFYLVLRSPTESMFFEIETGPIFSADILPPGENSWASDLINICLDVSDKILVMLRSHDYNLTLTLNNNL